MNESIIMEAAWYSFVDWAGCQQSILDEFHAATGLRYQPPPKTPLDAMIDQATGYDKQRIENNKKVFEEFVLWVSENVWGLDESPPKVRAAIEAKKKEKAK